MSCECCDGEGSPKVAGEPELLFCVRGRTLVMRALSRAWQFPQWLLTVNYCPVCGRDLRAREE